MSDELIVNDKQAMSALKKHGGKIVWVIVGVLAGYFGWEFYQKNYAKIDTVAADSYTLISEKNDALTLGRQNSADEATKAELAKEQEALFADIDKLVAGHGETAYAWQALMIKARHQADAGDFKGAIATLTQARGIDLQDEGLSAINTLRLAQATLANGDAEGALTLANQSMPEAFTPSRQELLGDIYVAKNDTENAKKAYDEAWNILVERQEVRSLLSLKMQMLGMTPKPITPKSAVSMPTAPSQTADATTPKADTDTAKATDDKSAKVDETATNKADETSSQTSK